MTGTGSVLGWAVGFSVNVIFSGIARLALTSAAAALHVTASLLANVTEPTLAATWFSGAYWRVAAVAALLTLPFLFAAGVHALVRSDVGLVARAAFGYLPLGMLGVSIAAPLTTMSLAATDASASFVAGVAGDSDSTFLGRAAAGLRTPALVHGDLFIAFIVALITIVAAIGLWIELLIRSAAVEVIVLMLPLFFAAMVWPARRVWAVRVVETLVALILSKFAIVAVLTLGGAALSQTANGPAALLTGATLILLAALAPWALLRLLPLHEVAAAAAGGLSQTPRAAVAAAAGPLLPQRGGPSRDGDGDTIQALRRLAGGIRGPAPEVDETQFSPMIRDGLQAVRDGNGDGAGAAGGIAGGGSTTASAAAAADDPRGQLSPQLRPSPASRRNAILADGGGERMGPFPVAGPSGDRPVADVAPDSAPTADEPPPAATDADSPPPLPPIAQTPPAFETGVDASARLAPPAAEPPTGDG